MAKKTERAPASATEADVAAWCCQYLARQLRRPVDGIDRDAAFAEIGLDSAEALFMVSALEDWSGLELDSNSAYEHPSVTKLSRFVGERLSARR